MLFPTFPATAEGNPQTSTVLLVFPMAAAGAATGWLRRATAGLRGAGSSTPGPAPSLRAVGE